MSKAIRRSVSSVAATAVAAMALILAGCSSGSSGNDTASGVATAGGTPSAPTGVTITLWHSTSDPKALLDLYTRYEKASGNTIQLVDIPVDTFNFETNSKWGTGERPDLMEWNGNPADARSLNMAENAIDLSDLPFVEELTGVAASSGEIDGKIYAATLGPLQATGVLYNKQVFEQAGLEAPTNYADLASDCATLQSKVPDVTPIFEAGGSGWPAVMLAGYDYMAQFTADASDNYSDEVLSGKVKLNDPSGPFVAGMTAYDDLHKAGCFNSDFATATWESQTQALLDGKTAMVGMSTEAIAQLETQANGDASKLDDIGFVGVSATKAVASVYTNFIGTFYAPKTGNADKEAVALDFIKFATSDEQYQQYVDDAGIIPTLSSAKTPTLSALWQDVADALPTAGLNLNATIPGYGPNFGTEAESLLVQQETPQQVADKMQSYFEQAQAALQ